MQSTLRIIGGKWRSRKINFLLLKEVRPTTNVTRETLFNWLAPAIIDSSCLDLFAGSGALGFEALSRGAAHVTMVDAEIKIVKKLAENSKLLQATNAEIVCAKVPERMSRIPQQLFNIVFIDPPFHRGLVKPTCDVLISLGFLTKNALIYIEVEKQLDVINLVPASWQLLRQKTVGMVKIHLFQAE